LNKSLDLNTPKKNQRLDVGEIEEPKTEKKNNEKNFITYGIREKNTQPLR